jgi:3-oxoacyl-[acyl-carrier protein] reductase
VSDLFDVFRLDGRVAVVTGAASGIGRAIADVLAAAGARVVLGDLDAAGAQTAAREIAGRGGTRSRSASTSPCARITRRSPHSRCASGAASTSWANVAVFRATVRSPKSARRSSTACSRSTVKGTLFGCQTAVRAMAGRGGSIINVASGAIDLAVPNYGCTPCPRPRSR